MTNVPQRVRKSRMRKPRGIWDHADVGSGLGDFSLKIRAKHPEKRLVAVDTGYRDRRAFENTSEQVVFQLNGQRIQVFPGSMSAFVHFLQKNRERVKVINMAMPHPDFSLNKGGFGAHFRQMVFLVKRLPHILVPNGKMYITSEMENLLEELSQVAAAEGLSVRFKPNLTQEEAKRFTYSTNNYYDIPIRRLEITFGLKRAFPQKSVRRTKS